MKRTADTATRPGEKTAQPQGKNRQRRVCPECGKERVRRSRRRSFSDYLLGIFGLRPYRCHECDYRYHARGRARPQPSRWAQCPRCGASGVDPVARHKVSPTWENLPRRMLFFSAYRCPECRMRFFDHRSQQPKGAETP